MNSFANKKVDPEASSVGLSRAPETDRHENGGSEGKTGKFEPPLI